MIRTDNVTIVTFCHELALALHQITGKTIDICPDLMVTSIEADLQFDNKQTTPGDLNDTQLNEYSPGSYENR